jgi:hypothetical protein
MRSGQLLAIKRAMQNTALISSAALAILSNAHSQALRLPTDGRAVDHQETGRSKDNRSGATSHQVVFEISVDGSNSAEWRDVEGARVALSCDSGAVMVHVTPDAPSSEGKDSYATVLTNPTPNLRNRWQVRFLRDSSFQVGAFILSNTASATAELRLPLSFMAIDAPPPGLHVYTIQIRYLGDRVNDEFGRLHIQHARFVATAF